MSREADLKSLATDLGFDVCRIARVDEAWDAGKGLQEFLAAGHHATMAWMEDTAERRAHPQAMWPDAKSAVVVGLNYGPETDPLDALTHRSKAAISVYAKGKDYHDVLKKRLKRLARAFAENAGEAVKVFVDTAPLMEKPLAAKAGLGWQGKHTNLVSRDLGSWLFLGVMLTTAELTPDSPETDHCGTCEACLDICPTDALPAPYTLDARRCLSYLSIEHKGPIPHAYRAAMGNRIYGCDDCLAVCPWNKFAVEAREAAFHARHAADNPPLQDLLTLNDASFRARFSGSPIKRIGRDRFVRNTAIAAGNSDDASLLPAILELLSDDSPLVRGAATWALSRLDPARFLSEKARLMDGEPDAGVREEWNRGVD